MNTNLRTISISVFIMNNNQVTLYFENRYQDNITKDYHYFNIRKTVSIEIFNKKYIKKLPALKILRVAENKSGFDNTFLFGTLWIESYDKVRIER